MLSTVFRDLPFSITKISTIISGLIFWLLLLAYQLASATAIINVEWDKKFGGNNSSAQAYSILQTKDGGFAVAGSLSKGAASSDIWIIRLDTNGNLLWEKTFGGSHADNAYSMVQTTDGDFVVAGTTENDLGYDNYWIFKLNANGTLIWDKVFTHNYSEKPYSIIQTTDGGFAVAGYTLSKSGGMTTDYWILKLDATGKVEWDKALGGYGGYDDIDVAKSIVQTPDGGFVVAGYTDSKGAGGNDFWVVKLTHAGVLEWDRTLGGNYNDEAHAIITTVDGGFAVAGTRMPNRISHAYWMIKLDQNGDYQWDKSFEDEYVYLNTVYSIIQTTDGGFALAGYGYGPVTVLWVPKLDSQGDLEWERSWGTLSYTGYSKSIASIIQTQDGGFAVAGNYGTEIFGSWVFKFKAIPCTYDINPLSHQHDGNSNSGIVTVSTSDSQCAWRSQSEESWLTTNVSSTGNGSVNYSVEANNTLENRSGNIVIAGKTFTVEQGFNQFPTASFTATREPAYKPLTLLLNANSSSDSDGTITDYKWTASDGQTLSGATPKITFSQKGTYTISLVVTDNNGASSTKAQKDLTVNTALYTLNINKLGTGEITGEGIHCGSDCSEDYLENTLVLLTATASADSPFVGWGGACSGSGICEVTMTTAQSVRATFDDGLVLPNQCVDQITPTTLSHGSDIETGTVTVSAAENCQWTAVSDMPWININHSSGQGSGKVSYSVTANPTIEARSGTLSIAGKTVTVNQDQGVCSYSITPTSHTHSANAETGNVSVITSLAHCEWTARSNELSFLNIKTTLPIQGNGTVVYSMTANTSSENRQGTLTVAGQTFTVNQERTPCTPPIPVINVTPSQSTAALTVTVDGSESYDREGIIKTYAWTTSEFDGEIIFQPYKFWPGSPVPDRQFADTPKADFTFSEEGNYHIKLVVTDDCHLSATQSTIINVSFANTHLNNLSTRARIQGGTGNIIAGFGIRGQDRQTILVRGRSLEAGVDPELLLQNYSTLAVWGRNDNWEQDTHHSEIPSDMRPDNITDAALLRDLPKGYYTVHLSSKGAKGLGIVEVFRLDQTSSSTNKFFNISTRALVEGGADDIITNFIIEDLQKVVVRGTAVEDGIDLQLILQELGKTEVMAQNDNWQDDPRASEIPPHLQPNKATDAALLLDLPKGAYTVSLTSVGAKKLGLIEVFAVD